MLSKNHKLTKGSQKGQLRKRISENATHAYNEANDIHEFANNFKYRMKQWGDSHATKKALYNCLYFETNMQGTVFICEFRTALNGDNHRDLLIKLEKQ